MTPLILLALAASPLAKLQATPEANRPSRNLVVYNEEFPAGEEDGRARFDRFAASDPIGADGNPKPETLDACAERCSYWSFSTASGRSNWTIGEGASDESESIRGSVVEVAGQHLVRMEKISDATTTRAERVMRRTEIVVPDDGRMNWSYVPSRNASGEPVMLLTVAWIGRPERVAK